MKTNKIDQNAKRRIIAILLKFAGVIVALGVVYFTFGGALFTLVIIGGLVYLLYIGANWMDTSVKRIEDRKAKSIKREKKRARILEEEEDRLWRYEQRKKIRERLKNEQG